MIVDRVLFSRRAQLYPENDWFEGGTTDVIIQSWSKITSLEPYRTARKPLSSRFLLARCATRRQSVEGQLLSISILV